MLTRTRAWQTVVCVSLCAMASVDAFAVSGRGLAIGRAFSYANNNPRPTGGGVAPLSYGSSMESSYSPYRLNTLAGISPLYQASSSRQVYSPMAPLIVSSSGGSPGLGYAAGYAYSNPVREVVSVLEKNDKPQSPFTGKWLTSLAPDEPGVVRLPMMQGEEQFRKGDYPQALASFQSAREASKDSPESLLSLVHVYFAMGDKYYDQAADCLAKALKQFPDLPLARVRPQDFFGSADAYAKARATLEQYVKDNPKNAAGLMLLGYIQWRERLIDKALDTLDAAAAASPGKDLADGITAMLDGIARSGQVVLSDAPPLRQPKDYSWAGIRLALPNGFEAQPLTSLNQVLSGMVAGKGGESPQMVALQAYPVHDSVSVKAFTDSVMDSMRQMSFIKDMKTEAEAEVPFQTGKALVRIFTYSSAGTDTRIATAWVAFIRDPKDNKGPSVAYLLGVASGDKESDKLLPTLAAIAKSIVLTDPTQPAPAAVDIQGNVIEDREFNVSVVQPAGWAGQRTDKGYEMGQMDFAFGSGQWAKAEVIVQEVPGTQTPKAIADAAALRKAPEGMVRKVLSEGPAKLAGQEGYQLILGQAPAEGTKGPSSVMVGRVICVDQPDGGKRAYAIVVDCRDVQVKDAEVLAGKIADGVKILGTEDKSTGGK